MRSAAFLLGMAGGVIGVVVGATVIVLNGAVDSDGHIGGILTGLVLLLPALAGIAGAILYRRGVRPAGAAIGMIVAGVVHAVANPIFGTAGGLLLLIGGLCGLLAIENRAQVRRERLRYAAGPDERMVDRD